jgi:hypothetical protein
MDFASLDWTLARAGGVVAYLLLSASVVLGLVLSGGWRTPEWPRFIAKGVHEHLTLAALVFTIIHGLAVWLDPFLHVGLTDVLVPLAIAYRPVWVALGIVAGYLMLALWLSERIRPWIGYRAWRALHFASFAAYVLATGHGLASGTDTTTWWAFAMYALSVSGVLVLLLGRLAVSPGGMRAKAGFGAAAGALVVVGGAWALQGPLQPNWGPSAGSRASLTSATNAAAATPAAGTLSFDAQFTGSEQLTGRTLVISGGLRGRTGSRLEIDLQGQSNGSTFSVSSGRMTYTEGVASYGGVIDTIDDGRLAGTLTDAGGSRLNLVFTLGNAAGGSVSATVTARPS